MHVSYIILCIDYILKKLLGYRKSKYISIVIIIFYMLIVGFSPSIARASIMGILTVVSSLIYRKSDTLNNISFSALILLIINPFIIYDLGFIYSYAGTLGIVLFNKNIFNILKTVKSKSKKKIFDNKLGKSVSIILSAQIIIFPISILNNGTFGIYFIITNMLATTIIAPIIILGIIYVFILYINIPIASIIVWVLRGLIQLLLFISNASKLPFAKNYLAVPSFIEIIIYFVILGIIQARYIIYKLQIPKNQTILRFRNTIALIKYKLKDRKKIIICILLFLLIMFSFYKIIPKNLKINFIDVRQGDSTFIITPKNKTILIDGGGIVNSEFDVGKSILLPYLLNRGYNRIDYIIISHFDFDHVGGLFTIMEELKVGTVIISMQGEESENYKKFKEVVKEKKINVVIVGKGDRVKIENDLYFDILWPNNENIIQENILNNNSMVCKLYYKNFSMLFTGDIEEIAEKEILKEYNNNLQIFNSTVLKVGHHGSKTSSMQGFIEAVKPKIALIGVGKNNKFGHPNEEVLQRLQEIGVKIFRTDDYGEISIVVNSKGKIIKVNKCVE